jgi:hypothetical protein
MTVGWFIWGVVGGWSAGCLFYYSQTEDNKAAGSAAIIFLTLVVIAFIVSINLGLANGTFNTGVPTVTPTSLGR